jgi:hypothetical protein
MMDFVLDAWSVCVVLLIMGSLSFLAAGFISNREAATKSYIELFSLLAMIIGCGGKIALALYVGMPLVKLWFAITLLVLFVYALATLLFWERKRVLVPFAIFLGVVAFCVAAYCSPRWITSFRETYRYSVRLDGTLQRNMALGTPRGAEPTGEIWVRASLVPWPVKLGLIGRRNFKTFKTDAEALGILRPMMDRPVYLHSMSAVVSYPGILAEIDHVDAEPYIPNSIPDDVVIVESRLQSRGRDAIEDYPTALPISCVGVIYAYRETSTDKAAEKTAFRQ